MRITLYALLLVAAFTLYVSNGQIMSSYDSAPNSLLAFNVLERHTLDFDPFRNSYFANLGGQYAFTEAPNGHLTSVFPIGTAILTFPLYAAFYLHELRDGGPPAISDRSFEPHRQQYEKEAAAAIAALCVVLFLLCARMLGTWFQAGVATLTFAVGTSMWTVASQALWQHGPVNLLVLTILYLLLRMNREERSARILAYLFLAGIAAGLLPVVRPTAVLFSLTACVFVAWTFRTRTWIFLAGLVLGVLPGIAWNAYFFHNVVGGYAGDISEFSSSIASATIGFAGLLVSPSRGLFVFAPVLLFSIAGAWSATRLRSRDARLILAFTVAAAVLVIVYAFYREWWGGQVYGPRFLTDLAAIGCLLLIFVLPRDPQTILSGSGAKRVMAAVFAIALLWSAAVQCIGATSGAAGSDWNAIPTSVDAHPERLWRLRDNQIERNAHASYYKDVAWNITLEPGYYQGLALRLVPGQYAAPFKKRSAVDWTVLITNDGTSRAYGYDSGVFLGQVRIRVRFSAVRQRYYSEQYLYLAGSPGPGEQGHAIGTIVLPPVPGDYNMVFDPIALGLGVVKNGSKLAMHLKVT